MESSKKYHIEIVWKNVFSMSVLHFLSLVALTQIHKAQYQTLMWGFFCLIMSLIAVTGGSHRLWSHRSYKAKLPLQIWLAFFHSMAMQNSIFIWARDHRVHHKYSETDADPHNAKRGFFFCHIGWMLVKKHPDVAEKGKTIVLDDLYDDDVIMFQHRYYKYTAILSGLVIPTLLPLYWGESLYISYMMVLLRLCLAYNSTWTVNSVAHLYGNRPYDKNIYAGNHMGLSIWAIGEGYHNYHHVFPQDYEDSEFGMRLNLTTMFIRFMALIGQAYDCRKAKKETVLARRKRTGDLSEAN